MIDHAERLRRYSSQGNDAEIRELVDLMHEAADRLCELEAEVKRLHDLHLERTKLTHSALIERDALREALRTEVKKIRSYGHEPDLGTSQLLNFRAEALKDDAATSD